MTNLPNVEQEIENTGLRWGGVLMLYPLDAIRMIQRCRDLGVRILGIDAFRVRPDGIQPVSEHSIDFTSSYAPSIARDEIWTAAREFVDRRLDLGLMFEVVIE